MPKQSVIYAKTSKQPFLFLLLHPSAILKCIHTIGHSKKPPWELADIAGGRREAFRTISQPPGIEKSAEWTLGAHPICEIKHNEGIVKITSSRKRVLCE
jgi:hypothetical protein